jgi:hypothetical protein
VLRCSERLSYRFNKYLYLHDFHELSFGKFDWGEINPSAAFATA